MALSFRCLLRLVLRVLRGLWVLRALRVRLLRFLALRVRLARRVRLVLRGFRVFRV